MLEINEEIIAKAKQARSVEELISLAKEHDFQLTEEEAGKHFEALNQRTGEISDEELDNVAGGGCIDPPSPPCYWCEQYGKLAHTISHCPICGTPLWWWSEPQEPGSGRSRGRS
ncbi:MAG: hypothetical protein PHY91_05730 [Tissierellia bacterium]|nr:hypothetical protein [Tissierellia bacterium]